MCIACEFPSSSGHWTESGTVPGPNAVSDRLAMLSALRAALSPHNLRVRAAGPWSGFQIATLSGRIENVRNLDEAWVAAEAMLGHPVDLLNPPDIA